MFAALLRFYDLASKPLHHDESLYGVYCLNFFKGEGYRYDPMMHGPFMFHFQLLVFFLFGVSDFSVRIAPALFGVLMVAGTYWLREYVGKPGVLCIALLLTFSPTHLYFSRFMRHDSYIACFTYMAVVFGLLYYRSLKRSHLYLMAASLALMFCVKENAYIHLFIFVTFLVIKDVSQTYLFKITRTLNARILLEWGAVAAVTIGAFGLFWFYLERPLPQWLLSESLDKQAWAVVLLIVYELVICVFIARYFFMSTALRSPGLPKHEHTASLLFAVFLFTWIYMFFYSTVLMNPGGVWDGLARKSLTYWWGQHEMQRIKGAFHYYVPFFALYELPVFLVALGGVLYKLSDTLNKTILVVWATGFSIVLVMFTGSQPLPLELAFTHMEVRADLILTLYVLFIGLWATFHFLRQRQTLLAFLSYWAAIGFLIYSYAGEKVPWLFLHIILPFILLAGVFLGEWGRTFSRTLPTLRLLPKVVSSLAAVLLIAYTLHSTILLNYYNPANPVERMVYTQTSTDVLQMLDIIREAKFLIGSEEARKPIIAVQGNAVWPMAWYLRDYDSWYHPGDLHDTQRPLVILDWEKREEYQETLADDYQEVRVKLREWWIPRSGGTLIEWWNYFLYRKVFNPTGSSDIALYIRKVQAGGN